MRSCRAANTEQRAELTPQLMFSVPSSFVPQTPLWRMVWGRDYVPANLKKEVLASMLGYVKQRLGSKKHVLLVILVGMGLLC